MNVINFLSRIHIVKNSYVRYMSAAGRNSGGVKRGRLKKKRTESEMKKRERIYDMRRRTIKTSDYYYKNKRKNLRLIQEFENGITFAELHKKKKKKRSS
mmetsp:Transcript_37979/g.60983  ORF Transcript_37979/g.60983 Transcript_37979/m.60983 type:complete len:99 (-) Transcript_37979:100-396(-)